MRANVRLRPTSRTGAQPIMAGVLWGIATSWVFGMALSGFADGPSGPAAMPDMSQGDCAPVGRREVTMVGQATLPRYLASRLLP